jgi:hypothetical protein
MGYTYVHKLENLILLRCQNYKYIYIYIYIYGEREIQCYLYQNPDVSSCRNWKVNHNIHGILRDQVEQNNQNRGAQSSRTHIS